MAADDEDIFETTKINDSNMVTVPARIRDRLDIGPGDEIQWGIDEEGVLTVDVVHHQYGAFDGFDPASMGGDGRDTHDVTGHHRTVEEENH